MWCDGVKFGWVCIEVEMLFDVVCLVDWFDLFVE